MAIVWPEFPLYGERISLQRFTREHLNVRYIGWLNDPEVVRYSNQRFFRHTEESCLAYQKSFEGSSNLFLSVLRSSDDVMIGTMTAYLAQHHGTVDVGIMMGESGARGQGYGQDAWNTMLTALSNLPFIRKITAGTLECNAGMLKLMERSGMHLEAIRRKQEIVEGNPCDIHYYARFNEA